MGTPAIPKPVRFFVSLLYRAEGQTSEAEQRLRDLLGDILSRTAPEPFLHTTYYEREMGKGLLRHFLLFEDLRNREDLIRIKLRTNDMESDLAGAVRRSINIDPGYLALEQVVLATTKGYAHRIYLGQGIFGDLTLIYTDGTYKPLPWTYPDYGGTELITLFNGWRDQYKIEVRRNPGLGKTSKIE